MTRQNNRALMLLIAGFTLWSGAFVLLYALQALGCAYGWGEWHRPILIVAYVVSLVPLAVLAWQRPNKTGEPQTSLSLSALWANRAAFVAGILVYLPVTFATACI
ncbi:hypothetical protein [Devosia chinhatensis]|uniref:Uncharacterized protein n=1 Tax=Devosia chinhatensis TaxID=429727 RepID=A0A0F5FJ73_9HYPH|nr:hypothetical protein [Devosia chinhatensis]KKB08600.1 hypothetical protein VE26_00410 [Devosia chinhatensis]